MHFTILGPNGINDAGWHLHSALCPDLKNPRYAGTEQYTYEADDTAAALASYIDAELIDMGWSNDDVRVFPCCEAKGGPIRPVDMPPVVAAHVEYERDSGVCQWFLLCEEPATEETDHPILGKVPTCAKHHAFGS